MKIFKFILPSLLIFMTLSCALLTARKVVLPNDLIYQQRLLLIFTPRQDLPLYQREEELLVNHVEGLASRDIQVYRLFPRSGFPQLKERQAIIF